MSSRLDRIKDWATVARLAGYFANRVAQASQVTPRQLERYFHLRRGCTPHKWLRGLRMGRAVELIGSGAAMKEVAADLGYKDAAHFARDFKEYHGVTPSEYVVQSALPLPTNRMSSFDKQCRV